MSAPGNVELKELADYLAERLRLGYSADTLKIAWDDVLVAAGTTEEVDVLEPPEGKKYVVRGMFVHFGSSAADSFVYARVQDTATGYWRPIDSSTPREFDGVSICWLNWHGFLILEPGKVLRLVAKNAGTGDVYLRYCICYEEVS